MERLYRLSRGLERVDGARPLKGQALAYVYFEDEPWAAHGGELADARRRKADRGEHRQAAGLGAQALNSIRH